MRDDPDLPRGTWAMPGDIPCCPWCRETVEAAQVTVGQISDALCDGQLEYADRSPHGRPHEAALVSDCPHCARPFMLAILPTIRCIAVRTDTDLRLIGAAT